MMLFAADVGDAVEPINKIAESVRQIANSMNSSWGLAEIGAVFAIIAAGASVMISYWAWKTSSRQASLMEDQHDAQIYIFIASVLREDDLRTARECVYEHLKMPNAEWPDKDERMARSVAGSFEIASTVTLKSKWSRKKLIEVWGQQIVKCWNGIEPLLASWRAREDAPKLFEPFRQLMTEVKEIDTARRNEENRKRINSQA